MVYFHESVGIPGCSNSLVTAIELLNINFTRPPFCFSVLQNKLQQSCTHFFF